MKTQFKSRARRLVVVIALNCVVVLFNGQTASSQGLQPLGSFGDVVRATAANTVLATPWPYGSLEIRSWASSTSIKDCAAIHLAG